jgi:hypothetical protein
VEPVKGLILRHETFRALPLAFRPIYWKSHEWLLPSGYWRGAANLLLTFVGIAQSSRSPSPNTSNSVG